MKITFAFPDGAMKTSPVFPTPDQGILDFFWDEFLGSEEEVNSELFWNSDAEGAEDDVVIKWFIPPTNPDAVITSIALALNATIQPYSQWN